MNLNYLLRVIKLTAFLYFIAFLQLSYASYSQTITYTSNRESLENILQVIKKQTQFEVLGTKAMLEGSKAVRSEEHTSELQSRENLVCRLLLEKKKKKK